MYRLRQYILLLMMALVSLAAFPASVKLAVTAGRGQREIHNGDQFYITIEVSDLDDAPTRPASVPGAKVLYLERTGQSSRFSSINGKVSQSHSYTYTMTLRAQEEGSFTFGPISVGGVESNVLKYVIGPKQEEQTYVPGNRNQIPQTGPDNSQGPKYIGKGDGNLFLKAEVSKSSAFPQEALVYTVKLFTTYDAIKFIGATAAPKFDGFVIEESDNISNSLEYETVNGKTYATAIIARYIIFPQMTGELKIKGNTYTVSVDEREYYHDPFWGNMSVAKPLQLNVTPNDLTVNVKPLPAPQPANFSGGVGQFTITSTLPAVNYKSNNAGSIEYTVSGTGNLKYITLPDLNQLYPPQIEVYTPSTIVDTKVGKTNVTGKITFDYSFMPLEAGNFDLPPVTLSYFDPTTGRYETATAKGYTIHVEEGKGSAKSQSRNSLTFNPELMKVKEKLTPEMVPIVQSFGYWFIFYIIPFFLLICVLIFYRRRIKMNADVIMVRSRKASKVARKRLKRAETCMKKGETDKFYDVMLKSLWGYLSDKLSIPTSELNRANVKETLMTKGIEETVAHKVIEIIDECEFYKYSSAGNATGMEEIYDKAVDVIDEMESEIRKQKNDTHEK